jgi:hypothetical protein
MPSPVLGFWYRSASAFEHPEVIFKNQVYVEALLADKTTGTLMPMTFQTSNVKAVRENAAH